MLKLPRTKIKKASEQVVLSVEVKTPAERGSIMIDYTGQDEQLLHQRLDEAERRLIAGGLLYLTVPYRLDGELLVAALRARLSRIGPLNVGSNPQLQNQDVHTHSGYLYQVVLKALRRSTPRFPPTQAQLTGGRLAP